MVNIKNNRKHLAAAELVVETINQLEAELEQDSSKSYITSAELNEKFKTIQGLYKSLKYHVTKQVEQDRKYLDAK